MSILICCSIHFHSKGKWTKSLCPVLVPRVAIYWLNFDVLVMLSLAAASHPTLSETEPSCLCLKFPAIHSVGEIALNPLLRKIYMNTVLKNMLLYRINSSCKLFLLMYI